MLVILDRLYCRGHIITPKSSVSEINNIQPLSKIEIAIAISYCSMIQNNIVHRQACNVRILEFQVFKKMQLIIVLYLMTSHRVLGMELNSALHNPLLVILYW